MSFRVFSSRLKLKKKGIQVEKMMKLFASDYDGTYWKHTGKGQLDLKRNIKMTKRWQKEGHLFVFATGRPISLMRLEERLHGIVYDYIVGLNGGIIVSKDGEILFQQAIEEPVVRKIIKVIQTEDFLQYGITDGICGHYQTTFGWRHKTFYLFKLFNFFFKQYNLSLEESLKRPVVQISVKMKSHEQAIVFAKKMNQEFGDDIVAYSNLRHVDISAKGLSKATGVDYVAKLHHINADQVYCMGDSFNDVPMFETFHGYTLPEACDEIKQCAEKVFETVEAAMKFSLKK